MIVKIASRGTSFKGAAAYYLHDKKRDGELTRSTSERVSWTATRNITSESASFAFRVMAATAMDKDRLKEQAGISKVGRKTKGDVYAYSVAWHPDEHGKFSKVEMLKAVDETLKVIGAENYQAVIIAHNDEPQPHAHVIVNLVNPENGKNLPLNYDRKRLDEWAYEYRKARGEEEIYCPARDRKAKAIEARKQGQKVAFVKGGNITQNLYKDFSELRALAVNDNEIDSLQSREANKDRDLVQLSRKIKKTQLNQHEQLDLAYQKKKRELEIQFRAKKAGIRSDIPKQLEPAFAELYRQQANELKMFNDREKRLSGKLVNAIDIVKRIREISGENDKGFLSMAFGYFARQGSRSVWIERRHQQQIKELQTQKNKQLKEAISHASKTFKTHLSSLRKTFKIDFDALNEKQNLERDDLQVRWTSRNLEKKQAIEALKRKGRIKSEDGKHLEQSDIKRIKQEYVESQLEKGKTQRASRKGRRSRTRKRD